VCHDYQNFLFNRNWMTLNVVKVDSVQRDIAKVNSGCVFTKEFSFI
jgi:hypothetical protein